MNDRAVSSEGRRETPEAKARWFLELSLRERTDLFAALIDLAQGASSGPTSSASARAIEFARRPVQRSDP